MNLQLRISVPDGTRRVLRSWRYSMLTFLSNVVFSGGGWDGGPTVVLPPSKGVPAVPLL